MSGMLSLHSAEGLPLHGAGTGRHCVHAPTPGIRRILDTVESSAVEGLLLSSDPNMKLPGDVTPEVLDGAKEIYMNWTPGFDRCAPICRFRMPRPRLQVDSTAFLAYMLSRGSYWAVVPVSVADYIRKQVELSCSRLIQPPPDRVCCCLTKPQRQPIGRGCRYLLHPEEVYRGQERIRILL